MKIIRQPKNSKKTRGPAKKRTRKVITIDNARVYFADEIAEMLGCSEQMIRHYITSGELIGRKVANSYCILGESARAFITRTALVGVSMAPTPPPASDRASIALPTAKPPPVPMVSENATGGGKVGGAG